MALTYRELAAHLKTMSETDLDTNVTVYVPGVDEWYPLNEKAPIRFAGDECDVLDEGHHYLAI